MSRRDIERQRPESKSAISPKKLARQPEAIIGGTGTPQTGDVPLLTLPGSAPGKAARGAKAPAAAPAPERRGAVAPGRQSVPVRRWSVRLYSATDAQAWDQLRLQLGQQLGRMPSYSEIAAAAGVLASADDTVFAALVQQLQQQGEPR